MEVCSVGAYLSSGMVPQIRDVVLWERIKIALQEASGYNNYCFFGLLLRDANSTLVLFPVDGSDPHTTTTTTAAAAATVAWLHMENVEFITRQASSKVDGDVAALTLIRDRDAPFIILILRFEPGFELLKVGVAVLRPQLLC